MMDTHDEALFPALKELGVTYVSCCPLSKACSAGRTMHNLLLNRRIFEAGCRNLHQKAMKGLPPLLKAIHSLALEKGATNAQIALAI